MKYSEKQLQILETAEKLISTKGYEGTSVRDIAETAGINIAMISYYFGSKDKLMEALFKQRTENLRMRVEKLLNDSQLTPWGKINSLIEDFINRVMEKECFFKIMISEQVINKNPAVIQLIHEMRAKNIEEIDKLIREGQEDGSFKPDVDTLLLMSTLSGTVSQAMIGRDFYKEYHHLTAKSDEEVIEEIKLRLAKHIKMLFKTILTNEK